MKVIYIAGPFRGRSHWEECRNIRDAESLALRVWRLGHAALCPHLNTANFSGVCPDEVWLKGDLEMLRRCDAILMTDTWMQSAGATAERERARKLGIPVFYEEYFHELGQWLDTAASLNDTEAHEKRN